MHLIVCIQRKQLFNKPVFIRGDQGQLHQMVSNLIVNASEAIEGYSDISITLDLREISKERANRNKSERALSAGEYACLSISDTGEGMPADVIDKIFDPFSQQKNPGRGLWFISRAWYNQRSSRFCRS